MVGNNASDSADRVKSQAIMYLLESFNFVFMAHLMISIFGYTDELSRALQRKDRNIVNTMTLVKVI